MTTTEGVTFNWQPDIEKPASQANGHRANAEGGDGKPDAPAIKLPNLPEEFWQSREIFQKIRNAAWNIGRSGDAVFGSIMGRMSGAVHHELRFDFGRGRGSLNTFVNPVGGSGLGKTQAYEVGADLILPPTYLCDELGRSDPDKFRDGVGIGTGEGLAEAFMGTLERETGEFHARNTGKANKGDPVMEKYRGQVRHNISYFVDEGETLSKLMMERTGSTIGAAIRTAWNGGALGQQNARDETTRLVPRGSYSMGMVIGYQPRVALTLLADDHTGTPQRFLWFSAVDPKVPDYPPDKPAPFRLPLCDGRGNPITGVMDAAHSIRQELWDRNLQVVRGEEARESLDSHVDLMLCKVACMMAILDYRPDKVTEEDWQLANLLWLSSCAIRDALIEHGERDKRRKAERETQAYVDREERAHVARKDADTAILRIGRNIANYVHDKGPCSELEPKGKLAYRDRGRYDSALSYAVSMGWVVVAGAQLSAGEARPV